MTASAIDGFDRDANCPICGMNEGCDHSLTERRVAHARAIPSMTSAIEAGRVAHTAGPWQVVEATVHHGFYIVSDYGPTICDLYTMSKPSFLSTANGGPSKPIPFMHEMDGPNAHLIAAAPELLEALEALLPTALCGESYGLPDSEHVSIDITFGKLKAARAAIAKARAAS